jgi:hypothetical protein
MVYQCTTTQGFVTYEPDKIDPFAWTEFNADARVVCARPQKKKSASSRVSIPDFSFLFRILFFSFSFCVHLPLGHQSQNDPL